MAKKLELKPSDKIIQGKVYYAFGKKGDMNVNLCVEILEIGVSDLKVMTMRNDIPDSHNSIVYLPLDTIKFYPMKDRFDYKVIKKFK